jgi:hypothetical protein
MDPVIPLPDLVELWRAKAITTRERVLGDQIAALPADERPAYLRRHLMMFVAQPWPDLRADFSSWRHSADIHAGSPDLVDLVPGALMAGIGMSQAVIVPESHETLWVPRWVMAVLPWLLGRTDAPPAGTAFLPEDATGDSPWLVSNQHPIPVPGVRVTIPGLDERYGPLLRHLHAQGMNPLWSTCLPASRCVNALARAVDLVIGDSTPLTIHDPIPPGTIEMSRSGLALFRHAYWHHQVPMAGITGLGIPVPEETAAAEVQVGGLIDASGTAVMLREPETNEIIVTPGFLAASLAHHSVTSMIPEAATLLGEEALLVACGCTVVDGRLGVPCRDHGNADHHAITGRARWFRTGISGAGHTRQIPLAVRLDPIASS